jgi:integrase
MAYIEDRRTVTDRATGEEKKSGYKGTKPYRVRYRGPDGSQRTQSFARRHDAQVWLDNEVAKLRKGDWTDPGLGRIKFRDWVAIWETTLVHIRPRTKILNVGVAKNYLIPRFGDYRISAIATTDIREMMAEEMAATEGRLSNSAIRRHVLVMRVILEAAVADGRIVKNPAKAVKLPPEDSRDMRFLEPEEVAVLVKTIEEHYRPMVLTAAYVGLRWGELIGLAVENVDLDAGRIRVERQISEVHGKLVFGPPKTKAGIRTVTIPRSLCEVLEPHLKTWAVQTSGLVFPGPKGGPLRAPSFRKVWRRACLRAGFDDGALEGLVFHELRHTAAALAIAQGAHPMAIKERLGHASITTTLDRYGGLFPRLDETIAEGLDAVLRDSMIHDVANDLSAPTTHEKADP